MEHIDMCCLVYLDDVLIYLNTLQQHRREVCNMLERIRNSGMKVKLWTCELHQRKTESLGLIIGEEGIETDPVNTQPIWNTTTPKKITEIPYLLEFCKFYRRFMKAFSRMAKPLYARTRKDSVRNCQWGDKEQGAFNELRTKLTTTPVRGYLDPGTNQD